MNNLFKTLCNDISIEETIEFLNQYFPEFTFFTFDRSEEVLDNNKKKKKNAVNLPKWTNITRENYKQYVNKNHKAIAILTGKISNLNILDFDTKHEYHDLIIKHPELKTFSLLKLIKGFICSLNMMNY